MIILDTHIWYWWINQVKLSPKLVAFIENSEQVTVSSIACFEMAWLVKHQRIRLEVSFEQWFNKASAAVGILPVTSTIATRAANLPEHHRDPMDRLIIGTALQHQAQLLSFDSEFAKYRDVGLQLIDDKF